MNICRSNLNRPRHLSRVARLLRFRLACYAAAMWKWTIKFDKAFEIPTYRVKADGLIIGTIRKLGGEWSWEVTFPAQTMPADCRGIRPTRDECQEAIREKFQALTVGMTRDEARQMILSAIYRV